MPVTDVLSKDGCIGCGACASICPVDALRLCPDEYGYYVATIEQDKCINCGACERVCPNIGKHYSANESQPDCYAFVSGETKTLLKSTSGGAFFYLAKSVLNKNGIVFGAAWNDGLLVEHIGVQREEDLAKLQKSKYLQSYLGIVFREVKTALKEKRNVLFSGCPCQIAGLKNYLGEEYENLVTVDVLCGNSPSALFFKKYLIENFPEGAKKYEFRHKDEKKNLSSYSIEVTDFFGKTEIHEEVEDDSYQKLFHEHSMCASHCEKCNFHLIPREADISIGDFWGIQKHNSKIPGQHGVSLVLCNNEKGRRFWEETIATNQARIAYCEKVPLEWVGNNGYMFKGGTNYSSPFRDIFFKEIINGTFSDVSDMISKERKRRDLAKYREDYAILLSWMKQKQKNQPISTYLKNKGISHIAVYGLGDMGKLLLDDLRSEEFTVDYVVDRRCDIIGEKVPVYGIDDDLPDTQMIVVTVQWDYDRIKSALEGKGFINRICSVKELFCFR